MPYKPLMMDIKDRVFQMRASEEWLRRVDDWRRKQDELPPRAEAIRRLVDLGIKASEAEASPSTAPRRR